MNFKFWKKKIEIPSPFQFVYKDKFGNEWRVLKNPANLCAERALAAWAFMEDSKYGLTRENMNLIINKINTAINKSDLAEVAKMTGLIETCLELYSNEQVLLNLASVYCFLNDEENDTVKDHILQEKRRIWNEDTDARSFFLQLAWTYTARYSESPQLNVPEYLVKMRPVINEIISRLAQLKSPKKG